MSRIWIRLVVGVGVTATGALVVRNEWSPAVGYCALFAGLAILVVAGWRWLERDRDRHVRWSNDPRVLAFYRDGPPRKLSVAGSASHGPAPLLPADTSESLPAQFEQVGVGQLADDVTGLVGGVERAGPCTF